MNNLSCILHDPFLVLHVGKFDPGIELGQGKQFVWPEFFRREERNDRCNGGKPLSGYFLLVRSGKSARSQCRKWYLFHREGKGFFVPDIASLVGDQQGLSLVSGCIAEEIKLYVDASVKGKKVGIGNHPGPPGLAFQHFDAVC